MSIPGDQAGTKKRQAMYGVVRDITLGLSLRGEVVELAG
jgi:hypothetical protein